MSLIDSLQSLFKSAPGSSRIDVEGRFQQQRYGVTGTMANFFVAKDSQNGDRMVGVKVLELEKMRTFENRFKGLKKPSEGEIAMMMQHPQIVDTYEIGTSPRGEPVIVMEYIAGPGLQNIIQQKLEHHVTGKRLMLIRQMAEALKYVHSKGFIHRDICPRNFICTPGADGIKLIDFGLTVPATPPFMTPGNRTGTPLYMSPEIVRRRPTDKRVDLFSLGVTFYCLIAFQHPWQGEILNGRAALQHDSRPPTDLLERCPKTHPKLARAIMQMCDPVVDTRMESIEQFLRQIESVDHEFID